MKKIITDVPPDIVEDFLVNQNFHQLATLLNEQPEEVSSAIHGDKNQLFEEQKSQDRFFAEEQKRVAQQQKQILEYQKVWKTWGNSICFFHSSPTFPCFPANPHASGRAPYFCVLLNVLSDFVLPSTYDGGVPLSGWDRKLVIQLKLPKGGAPPPHSSLRRLSSSRSVCRNRNV